MLEGDLKNKNYSFNSNINSIISLGRNEGIK